MTALPRDDMLHAYIDGELDAHGRADVERAMQADPDFAARVTAFQQDKQRLAAYLAPVADQSLPSHWITLVRRAAPAPAGRPRAWRLALAASVALVLLAGGVRLFAPAADTILAEAEAAHDGTWRPETEFAGASLPQGAPGARLLQDRLSLAVRPPDLSRFGYRLVAIDLFRHGTSPAAGLVYRNERAAPLTIYIRRSSGEARFDLLRRGRLRECIWQDDVVGAVLTGEMSAGEMMRIASKAYGELNI